MKGEDGGNSIESSKGKNSVKESGERMISFGGREDDKENLLEKCLTASDLNCLVIPTNDAMLIRTTRLLSFEDKDGESWMIRCSYVKQSYAFTIGWSSYVREKKLRAGDFVFFQRHCTDRSRMFIGCRRLSDGDAGLQEQDYVLPDPTSPAASSVNQGSSSALVQRDNVILDSTSLAAPSIHQGRSSALVQQDYVLLDPTSPAASSVHQGRSSAIGQRDYGFLDQTSLDRQFSNYEFSREDCNNVLSDPTSSVTSSKAVNLREKVKEVENPVLVISCGDNQESEETYFISYIVNELSLRGFSPLRYDLTRSTVTGDQEMLYSSRVGIMIISMNYACSRECLDGFLAIMDHLKGNNLVLTPVFFEVSISDVRNQSGSFGTAFLRLVNSLQASQVQKWWEAMINLTNINGYQYMKGSEVVLSKNIVRDVSLLLTSEDNGIKLRLEKILSLLNRSKSSAPHIVGLWGMAGIGKTTIAREIFRTQAERYDACYFLPDFHIMCEARGLSHLHDEFLSKIFGEENVIIDTWDTKLSFLRDRFLDKRVLIVLDGVTNARDVEVLVGGFGWFSGGHTIILTSRNRQVLVQCNAKEIYEIPDLSTYESFRLFVQFQTETSPMGSIARTTMSELVKYAGGNPLALRSLASSIHNKYLRVLRLHPPIEIQAAFRKSFDGLDDNEKNIFLDLACFFRGKNKDHVVNILDGCGFFTDMGICGLIDESLISLVDNKIKIPNIFQDTGRFLVRQEHIKAGKCSRLWNSNDIANVLIKNSGTEAIEAIFFAVSRLTVELSPTVFEGMYRLRLLKLDHGKVCLPLGLQSLPDELRLLHWEIYPLGSLPQNFSPKNLVELNMPYSNMIKLWKGTKNLEKLKRIILSHSRQLTEFPRLSKAENLEHIDLEGCTSLVKVNSSILYLQNLTFLNLKDCLHLRIMPSTVHLESLEVLNLSGCSELEDLHDFSPSLKELYLAGTAISEIPSSIGDLTRLVTLDLEDCERLQHLPQGIGNLKALVTLKLSGCSNLKSHPTLDAFFVTFDEENRNRLLHLPPKIRNKKTAVTLRAKRPDLSMDISTGESVAPPHRRYQLKTVIESVIRSLRKRRRVMSVSTTSNLSEVQLRSASTSVNDFSYTSFWKFHDLPERPSQPECQYYMKTGECKFGNACRFHHPKDRETHVSETASSMASVTPNLNPPGLSFPLGSSSSSGFVEPSTKKLRIHKNTSSMVSETSHLNPHGVLPSLGTSSFVSDITQASVPRDTIVPKKENYGDIWDVREW